MPTNITQIKNVEKDSKDVTIDLEFEHYLFEVYLNDRIENEIQRMMEFSEMLAAVSPKEDCHELQ
jgi:hypothetical protein